MAYIKTRGIKAQILINRVMISSMALKALTCICLYEFGKNTTSYRLIKN